MWIDIKRHCSMIVMRPLPGFLAVLVTLFAGFANAQTPSQPDEFTVERTFFRTSIDNRSVRLEGLVVKLADAKERMPIALITHGKSSNLGDMLESRAAHYTGVARDMARRGYLAVVVM